MKTRAVEREGGGGGTGGGGSDTSINTRLNEGRQWWRRPPPIHPSTHPSTQPASQPAGQPGCEHIAGPEGSAVDNLRCVHMAEQRASEEDWHAETKQVYDSEA
ncbi:unnamed protein product [Pleuronectes platessa]|uniref:Uncharacterized protein n=1 Tax=Pleuronectes platessa TaxID=8262 RepID=A0A9N7TMF2_PLEPL|nr:unnamed protein product [Pleuronectes platessa]